MTSLNKLTIASLFCGAGGLDMGFEQAGYKTVWANDFDACACATYKLWNPTEVVHSDISEINLAQIPKSDIILGGFPCQGFSLSGPRNIDDSRNKLYKEYVKIVDNKKPLAFIGENVKGLLTMGQGHIISKIIEDFSKCGYNVFKKLLNSKDYGIAQDRERVIIIGFRKDLEINNFDFPIYKGKSLSLKDAIGHMPEPSDEEVCRDAFSSRYMSRNRKRNWDEVSYTIPAMAKQVTLHPSSPDMVKIGKDSWRFGENGATRRLSYKEAAAIQTFPEDMEFIGNLTNKYKQIGNAVPPKLAKIIAEAVYKVLEKKI